MVMTALAELLEHAPDFEPEIAIVGTTSGGMSFGENFYRTLETGGACSAALIANYPPQKQIVDAMEKFGINAPAQVIANACASGTNAIGHASNAIRTGRYQRILAGGYDALSELVFVGFDSLQAATPEKCGPFDSNSSGMLFGEVPVSSTKSMMGHSLGAAGAIEAVVSLLALQHQFLPPNINFREAELSLNIVANQPRDAQFDCAVSNSFGFGGTNATIVLRKLAR